MKRYVFVMVLWAALSGCDIDQIDFSDLEVPNLQSDIALPLGETEYTLFELLEEVDVDTINDVNVDEFDLISFTFEDSASSDIPAGSISITDTLEIVNQEIDVAFFDAFAGGEFYVQSPSLNFTFENGSNVPMGIVFDRFYAIKLNEETGLFDTTFLSMEYPNNQGYYLVPGNSTTEIVVSNDNTDPILTLFLGSAPTNIGFVLDAITNPRGVDTTATPTAGTLGVDLEIDLPMRINMQDIIVPFDFNLGGGVEFDQADSIAFRLVTGNLLPFSGVIDMNVMSAENDTLYRLENIGVLDAPNLDGFLEAYEHEVKISFAPISPEGISAINEADRVDLRVTLNTPSFDGRPSIFVPLLSRYSLIIKLSVSGRVNINL